MMKKNIIFFAIAISSFVFAFFTLSFFTAKPSNQAELQKINQVSLNQSALIAGNSQKLDSIFKTLSSLQQQSNTEQLEAPEIKNKPVDKNYKLILAELNQLKKQYQDIQKQSQNMKEQVKNIKNSNAYLPNERDNKGNTPNQPDAPLTKEQQQAFTEQRNIAINREAEKQQQAFENFYNEGATDNAWSDQVKNVFNTLISANKFGKNVSLQSVDCTTNMCVVDLQSPIGEKINATPTALFLALKGGSISSKKNKSSGQNISTLYITKPGEFLPPVAR